MSKSEQELFRIIRENDNPAEALMVAVSIILGYLQQSGIYEAQVPVCQVASV